MNIFCLSIFFLIGLGGFEIIVEYELASGFIIEVELKWNKEGIKIEFVDIFVIK